MIKGFLLMGRWRYRPFFDLWERVFARAPEERTMQVAFQFAAAQRLAGDYLEFGTFWGASFVRAYRFAQALGMKSMRFYAFDSFCGLPPVAADSVDGISTSIFKEGEFSCPLNVFKGNLVKSGLDMAKVDIIAGWYRETLTPELQKQLPVRKAAVILVDCDLYESTVPVLNFIVPYVQDGTVLLFDDWFAFKGRPDRGQPRAFAEWLARNPRIRAVEYRRHEWASMAFILWLD